MILLFKILISSVVIFVNDNGVEVSSMGIITSGVSSRGIWFVILTNIFVVALPWLPQVCERNIWIFAQSTDPPEWAIIPESGG